MLEAMATSNILNPSVIKRTVTLLRLRVTVMSQLHLLVRLRLGEALLPHFRVLS